MVGNNEQGLYCVKLCVRDHGESWGPEQKPLKFAPISFYLLYLNEGIRAGSSLQLCTLMSLDFLATQLERAMSYFNRYAFCFVALYGTDFITSSRWVYICVCSDDALLAEGFVVVTCNIMICILFVFVMLLCTLVKYLTPHYTIYCNILHYTPLHRIALHQAELN